MSTSYDIYCLDCFQTVPGWDGKQHKRHEETGFSNEIRQGEILQKLLVMGRPSLETIGMLLKDADAWPFTTAHHPLVQLLEFFGAHAGHQLEVRDEYGRTWAEVLADKP